MDDTAYAFNHDYRGADRNNLFGPRSNNDIALVRTTEPIRFHATRVAPAVLGNRQSRSRTGWQCRINGWGQSLREEMRNEYLSEYLRHAWNKIMSPATCGNDDVNDEIDTEICTEGTYRWLQAFVSNDENEPDFNADTIDDWVAPSIMHGDSGGPLSCHSDARHTYREQHMSVYAVVSHGTVWAGREYEYGYFTRVAAHIDWIRRQFHQFNEERRGREGHVDEELLLDGRHAAMGQFPYQVAVERQGGHRCSGAIIDKRWVVSAADCFRLNHNVTAGLVSFLVDTNLALQTRTCVRIERRGDLELCQMDRRFSLHGRFVKKIKFDTRCFEEVPEECVASSWESNDDRSSNHLTYKEAELRWLNEPLDVQENNQFDHESRTGPGAPLVCTEIDNDVIEDYESDDGHRYLYGINVAGRGNGDGMEGYLNVRRHIEWISQIIGAKDHWDIAR